MKCFLLTQIDQDGNETGVKEIIHGVPKTVDFLKKFGDVDEETLEGMDEGSFECLLVGDFLWDIDCTSEKDMEEAALPSFDPSIEAFEVSTANSSVYAFGRDSLAEELEKLGVPEKDIDVMELADPGTAEYIFEGIVIEQLDEYAIEQLLEADKEFALLYQAAIGMNESAEGQEDADPKMEEYDYASKKIKLETNGNKISLTIGGKKFEGFSSLDEAKQFSSFCIDCGGDDSGEMVCLEFSGETAGKAREAIDDSPYLKHNLKWTSANIVCFCDDEESSLLTEIEEHLGSFGLVKKDYQITKKQAMNESADDIPGYTKVKCCFNCAHYDDVHGRKARCANFNGAFVLPDRICDEYEPTE